MNVCDICAEMGTANCKHCEYGNPCLGCADYSEETDTCKSHGGCGARMAGIEKETMMRLIDADKAVQELQDYYRGSYSEVQLAPYQVDRWIEKRPTAMRWIPAGEQMPENHTAVLATVSSVDAGTFVTVAWRDNHEWEFYADDDIPADAEVIAWMELPEPAPAQEENDMPKTDAPHWIINFPCGPDGEHNYVCSSCGMHSWIRTEYCPHCGAKMDDQEGESKS